MIITKGQLTRETSNLSDSSRPVTVIATFTVPFTDWWIAKWYSSRRILESTSIYSILFHHHSARKQKGLWNKNNGFDENMQLYSATKVLFKCRLRESRSTKRPRNTATESSQFRRLQCTLSRLLIIVGNLFRLKCGLRC